MERCYGSFDVNEVDCLSCNDNVECQRLKVKIKMKKESKRISKDEYYLGIALAVSKRSTCLKRHYGAVIVKDDRIISTGYNGSPRGELNCCDENECKRANAERYSNYDICPAVHAEQNAMLSASHEELNGATLYLACEQYSIECANSGEICDDCNKGCSYHMNTWIEDRNPEPCGLCKRMIQNSGIKRVVNKMGKVIWG